MANWYQTCISKSTDIIICILSILSIYLLAYKVTSAKFELTSYISDCFLIMTYIYILGGVFNKNDYHKYIWMCDIMLIISIILREVYGIVYMTQYNTNDFIYITTIYMCFFILFLNMFNAIQEYLPI